MWKPYTNLLPALLCLFIIGCASGPESESESAAAPSVKVDASTLAAYRRAVSSMKNGQVGSAISQFSALSQSHPNLAGPFINLGILYISKGEYEKAEKNLLQATTIKPDDAVAQTHLGIAYRHLGKFDQAKTAYDVALKTNPRYPFAHLNAGILYDIYLDDLSRALNHYKQYQSLINGKDELVDKWIIDLERRIQNRAS
ncbi:MAG: tetratricopeptide repeat protein [Thioalkalispiraceae bacterium]|jgi:Flp pilus assembly protein TadD